ncbi:MAG: pteridine reductase [Gammaproteobacteria bacterium]
MTKTALITGAAKRIGAQIAKTMHANGYNIVVHHNKSQQLAESLVNEFNQARDNSGVAISAALEEASSAKVIVDAARANWGRLDCLVNCASVYLTSDPEQVDLDQWDEIMRVNLRAPYLLCAEALPMLRESNGNIINITDIYALRPHAGHPVYCASKAGLLGMTKALALDLAPTVRVNAVAPGPILWAEKNDPSYKDVVLAKTPLAKLGGAEAIAGAVSYLAEADFVTGEVIHVDGGRQIHI